MKLQDLLFLLVTVALVTRKQKVVLVYAGLAALLLAIPLFSRWIFFTAERLTWYAGAWFLLFIIFSILRPGKVQ